MKATEASKQVVVVVVEPGEVAVSKRSPDADGANPLVWLLSLAVAVVLLGLFSESDRPSEFKGEGVNPVIQVAP